MDNGSNDLSSRMTHPMSFAEAADWYKASCEYFSVLVWHDATIREATVSIYNADDVNRVTAEPISIEHFRKQ